MPTHILGAFLIRSLISGKKTGTATFQIWLLSSSYFKSLNAGAALMNSFQVVSLSTRIYQAVSTFTAEHVRLEEAYRVALIERLSSVIAKFVQ